MKSLLVILLSVAACSSNYVPQSRGRVAMVLRNGAPAYVRDGQVYVHGVAGSGLVKAVAGNPAAERAAHEYRSRIGWGLFYALGGLTCSVVSAGVAAHSLAAEDSVSSTGRRNTVPVSLWVSLGCLVGSFAGLGYLATAEPYRYDAINLFNDASPPVDLQGPPGYSAKRESLHMR